MIEALHYEFMRYAILAGLLTSLACGVMGTLVVVNRVVFLSGGIAHAAYGGIGLAFFLGIQPTLGAAAFALAFAGIMAVIMRENRERADTVIGVLWAVGMAIGIIFLDLTPGYNVDVMSYLFGSILAVSGSDLLLMVPLDILIVAVVACFYKDFLAMSFDEEFAAVMGVPVRALSLVLLSLVALSVVMTIRVVGLILVIALLTIPAYLAERHAGSLGRMMLLSFILAAGFTLSGLALSYRYNLTSGATIIMVAAVFFFGDILARGAMRRLRSRFGSSGRA